MGKEREKRRRGEREPQGTRGTQGNSRIPFLDFCIAFVSFPCSFVDQIFSFSPLLNYDQTLRVLGSKWKVLPFWYDRSPSVIMT